VKLQPFKFANLALGLALAAMLGISVPVASNAAFAADDKPKTVSATKDKNAPGQACKNHKPGSTEYKACIQENAKKGKKGDSAKKAASSRKTD
jgi:hypothetical protein